MNVKHNLFIITNVLRVLAAAICLFFVIQSTIFIQFKQLSNMFLGAIITFVLLQFLYKQFVDHRFKFDWLTYSGLTAFMVAYFLSSTKTFHWFYWIGLLGIVMMALAPLLEIITSRKPTK